jgi:hypothetical protein
MAPRAAEFLMFQLLRTLKKVEREENKWIKGKKT